MLENATEIKKDHPCHFSYNHDKLVPYKTHTRGSRNFTLKLHGST